MQSRSKWYCVCGDYKDAITDRICTACSIVPLNPIRTDQKTVAERKWSSGLKPNKPQQACDVGLFSDDSKQTSMF